MLRKWTENYVVDTFTLCKKVKKCSQKWNVMHCNCYCILSYCMITVFQCNLVTLAISWHATRNGHFWTKQMFDSFDSWHATWFAEPLKRMQMSYNTSISAKNIKQMIEISFLPIIVDWMHWYIYHYQFQINSTDISASFYAILVIWYVSIQYSVVTFY